eukprot:5466565-Prymnesium_polylepis.1
MLSRRRATAGAALAGRLAHVPLARPGNQRQLRDLRAARARGERDGRRLRDCRGALVPHLLPAARG